MDPFELMSQSLPAVTNQDDKYLCAACILPLRAGVSIRSRLFFSFSHLMLTFLFFLILLCVNLFTPWEREGVRKEVSYLIVSLSLSIYLSFRK